MTNPFENRAHSLSGPATDLLPVVPNDGANLPEVAVALYVETGGTLSLVTARGIARSVTVADRSILPVGVRKVNATGTSATGIHAMVIA